MNGKNLIYGLVDPLTKQLRYVGKSTSGVKRPRSHTTPALLKLAENTHKGNWLRQIVAQNLKPVIVVLETCLDAECLYEHEQFWIRYFRQMGCPLTNATDGGAGRLGAKGGHLTPEHRSRISAGLKGKKFTQAHRRNIALGAATRPPVSTALRRQNAASRGGRPFADEFGRIYYTQPEAAVALGVHQANICAHLKGRYKTVGGHTLHYI